VEPGHDDGAAKREGGAVIRLGLRSLLSRKLRTALTLLAIFLGVTMISGTYVLTDQIENGFKDIYDQAYSLVDVTVSPKVEFESAASAYGPVGYLPESLVEEIRQVDGVAAAEGYVYGLGSVVIDGKAVGTGGAPTIVYSYSPALGEFEADTYVDGTPPDAPNEVGIIKDLADKQQLKVGDTIGLTTEGGLETVTVTGIFTFADSPSMGGATVVHTTLADAQKWFSAPAQVSEIYVRAADGVSPEELAGSVRAMVPDGVEVRTGEQTAADTTEQINSGFVSIIRSALLAFGGVAVLVGAFLIFNTFSITIAQRLREFAMVRTLGASRGQVLWSVIGEALLMGVVAAVAGLFAGMGMAKLLNLLFKAVGADIPTAGIGLQTRTVVVGLVVGIGITLLAALLPAVRATRVPPMAALREGAVMPTSPLTRFMPYIAGFVGVAGAVLLAVGVLGGGSLRDKLLMMGAGVILLFVATAMVAKHVVRPIVAVVAWPLQKLAPTSGRLARENTVRNTSRTAATAAAMMIGLAVVAFVAVFAQSIKSSFIDAFNEQVTGAYVVTDSRNQGPVPLPGGVSDAVRGVSGVGDVSGIAFQPVEIKKGKQAPLYAIAPDGITSVLKFHWLKGGDDSIIDRLNGDTAIVEEQTATANGIGPGDTVTITTQQGTKRSLAIIGEYRDPVLLNGLTVSDATFAELYQGSLRNPYFMLVGLADGADPGQVTAGLTAALEPFPNVKAFTKQEYVDQVSKAINQTLMIIYALLALSVVISLFGIVNTLVLAVYERTREIGMLRAIGTSRRQVRRMVRYEAVITSLIGAVLGIALGTAFGFVVVGDLSEQGISFAFPYVQLFIFLLLAGAAGVVAAIVPARRAARLNILDAVHYE
jgi:putative ABC transport system permease protein